MTNVLQLSCAVPEARFQFNNIVVSPKVRALVEQRGFDPEPYLRRHLAADWGDLDPEAHQTNNDALARGDGSLLSAFQVDDAVRIWFATASDRKTTLVMFPFEVF